MRCHMTRVMDAMLTCRPMRRPELDLAVDWAAAEGWNPGLRDADAFWVADPEGFLLAELGGAEPVGCVSVVRYGPAFGFLGFYIVSPGVARSGAWARAVACRDGALGRPLRRPGRRGGAAGQLPEIRLLPRARNIRFGADGSPPPRRPRRASRWCRRRRCPSPPSPPSTRPASRPRARRSCAPGWPRRATSRWRRSGTGGSRATAWCGPAGGAPRSGRSSPTGGDGGGPVRLPRRGGARRAALPRRAGAERGGVALARDAGMAPVFETARMYTRPPPPIRAERVFGVTSFELG